MVLAAGLGTRMRPLTDHRPKPLIAVHGRTLIDRTLDALVDAGVQRAVVNVHYCADQMEAHLTMRTDLEIVISDERACLMETGGGVRQALAHLGREPIFVCNTDAFWADGGGAPLIDLGDGFDSQIMGARLLLVDRRQSLGFDGAGDFYRTASGALRLRGDDATAPFAYTGVQIVDPLLVAGEPLAPFSFMRIWKRLITEQRLFGAVLGSFWLHVGDPQAVQDANAYLQDRELRQ
jgi:MurNAc alpha-1-phosphate uridylyltransferase